MYKIAYSTNLGKREAQGDCLFIDGEVIQSKNLNIEIKELKDKLSLFCISDGMGGLQNGDKSSLFISKLLKENFGQIELSNYSLFTLFKEMQQKISKELKHSGTTLAGVLIDGFKAIIFNLGDSRVYKISKSKIEYLSHDHSLVQTLLDKEMIDEEEAFHHPFKNVVEFGFGDVFNDAWDNKIPYIKYDVISKDEYYLICSDGVNSIFTDMEILKLLRDKPFENIYKFEIELKEKMLDNFSYIILTHL